MIQIYMVYNTFINYSSLLQLCLTHTLCRVRQSMIRITNRDDGSGGEGEAPFAMDSNKVPFYGLN